MRFMPRTDRGPLVQALVRLGLDTREGRRTLAQMSGRTNTNKLFRRLDEGLRSGRFDATLLPILLAFLGLSEEAFLLLLQEQETFLDELEASQKRSVFKPHIEIRWWIESRSSPVFVMAMLFAPAHFCAMPADLHDAELPQVMEVMPDFIATDLEWREKRYGCFGRITGYIWWPCYDVGWGFDCQGVYQGTQKPFLSPRPRLTLKGRDLLPLFRF